MLFRSRKLANSRGYGTGFRIQIVGDGADWIENIVKNAFPGADIIFTVDFYHACEYVQSFLSHAGLDAAASAKAYRLARGILQRHGAESLVKYLSKRYPLLLQRNEAADALSYIVKRTQHMKYEIGRASCRERVCLYV